MANDWRIDVRNGAAKWQGFTFAATEKEARAQVAEVRCPGDVATVSSWDPEVKDYAQRFEVADEQPITAREVGQVVFAALGHHITEEQDMGGLEEWEAWEKREGYAGPTESEIFINVGTKQTFRITVREVAR